MPDPKTPEHSDKSQDMDESSQPLSPVGDNVVAASSTRGQNDCPSCPPKSPSTGTESETA